MLDFWHFNTDFHNNPRVTNAEEWAKNISLNQNVKLRKSYPLRRQKVKVSNRFAPEEPGTRLHIGCQKLILPNRIAWVAMKILLNVLCTTWRGDILFFTADPNKIQLFFVRSSADWMRIQIGPDFQIQWQILYGKWQNPDCAVCIARQMALYKI